MSERDKISLIINEYLDYIGCSASSQEAVMRLNRYLPNGEHITRQTLHSWATKIDPNTGFFYALLHHAPKFTPEYKLAHELLASMGRLL